ncbi:MAG: hypothetical protein WCP89_01520 [archaeon]
MVVKNKKKIVKKIKKILKGTIRIGKDLKIYEFDGASWKVDKKIKLDEKFPGAGKIINMFKAHNRFNFLVDIKNNKFLKGELDVDGEAMGARINILPDGKKLDKAYCLLNPGLDINVETGHSSHWDIIYRNKGGTYSYVYALEKKKNKSNKKYQKVEDFDKHYPLLEKNVLKGLQNREDDFAVPMLTLIKTCMRVGGEIYYKTHKHQGLATLTKKNISISGNRVNFNFTAKDGVELALGEVFPPKYVERLKSMLKPLKSSDFVFTNKNTGHPLKDTDFEDAFEGYCGVRFYPHIVRSHYATQTVKDYIKRNPNAEKDEIKQLFTEIAEKLGHRKFVKKHNAWEDSYSVTMHYYIQPEVLEKIRL